MGRTWKRLLSVLLAAAMILSLGVTGFAAGPDEEAEAEGILAEAAEDTGSEATELEMEELDPSTLGVERLGLDDDPDAEQVFGLAGESDPNAQPDGEFTEEELVGMDEEDLNEVVRVSIFLDKPSAFDAGFSAKGIGSNADAAAYRQGLRADQDAVVAQIESAVGHSMEVKWHLTMTVNAISAYVRVADIVHILRIPGVVSVQRENQYLAQEDEVAEPNTANTSQYMVGATTAWANGYTGAGSRIAIIDTGLDTSHQSFNADAFDHAIAEVNAARRAEEKDPVSLMTSIPSGLNGSGTRINSKIPYAYNYVDGNTTVTHLNDTQGEHGSHVAGIAAANRFIKSGSSYNDAASTVYAVGMAPDAQLLVMKVFGASGGAYDSDYMAAIEDAFALDCDAANLSLGSGAQGFTYANGYQTVMNSIADKSKNEGMVVTISAGNAGAFTDETESELYIEDVYQHTGGSPGTFINSLCVASADNIGNTGTPLTFNGSQQVFFTETATQNGGTMSSIAGSYNYVYIDATGAASDYTTVDSAYDLSGKVVIVNRGDISFVEKGNNAISVSPKALLIANNQAGTISMGLDDYTGTFPMASITLADANTIKANSTSHTTGGITYYTGTVKITSETTSGVAGARADAGISDFSSWGVPGSLIMKPEIAAPGGNIYSVFGTNKTSSGSTAGGSTQYELMSGTSMAAPHMAGLSAIVAQYLRDNDLSQKNSDLTDNYSTRAIIQSLLMSTATPMKQNGLYLPILQQGAGLAEVSKAVSASSVVMMDAAGLTSGTGSDADGKVKVELGDDPGRTGSYSFSFTIYNITNTPLAYELSTDLFTQGVNGAFMARTTRPLAASVSYAWDGETGSTEGHDVNKDGKTDNDDVQAILDYLTGKVSGDTLDLFAADMDGDNTVTSQDAQQLIDWEPEQAATGYIVPANGTASVTVSIQLTDDFSAYPNGAYIEGFTSVKCVTESTEGVSYEHEHTIPILGFYGSWTDPSMFDNTSYVDTLYGTEKTPYSGNTNTNYITVTNAGLTTKFTGNPYMVEDEFPADRLALNSSATIGNIFYNLIRSAGTTGFAISKTDGIGGDVTSVLNAAVNGNEITGMWFYQSQGTWQNTGTKFYSANKAPGSFGLSEGDTFRVGFYAIPEYNGMMINSADLTDAGAGALGLNGFKSLLTGNTLGRGAFIGYDFTIDNTDPEITAAALNSDNTITVSASDNQNLAYVAVLSLDGETKYAEAAPGTDAYSITFDATEAVNNAHGYVAVFVADYAGNEVARAVRVNDNTYEEKTVYVLTDSLTAGNDYLIVNRNNTGSGVALGHSGTSIATNAVTVKPGISETSNKVYIESGDVASTSVWTASSGIKLMNGNYYLSRNSNSGTTLRANTTNNYNTWTWDGSNNRLSMTISNRSYYLRYASNTFSLNTAANSVYVFQKTVIRTEVDPYNPTSINLTPTSLDLYKGNTADLVAKVSPLTAADRSVSWSSSNSSVATVDANGHVVAVGAGTATITATANGNTALTAECSVNVVSVDKNLNGIIWDEEGGVYFSSFNTSNLPTWNKLHNDAKGMELVSAVYQSGTLYAGTLDTSNATSTLYTVNTNSYALTEVGTLAYYATDIAPGPTTYASQYGIMVQPYGPYLLLGDVSDPGGGIYGNGDMSSYVGDDVYIAAVAARSLSTTSGTYYFLDENGTIWQTSLSGTSFRSTSKVVETGIATSFLYQSLYYDGTYLYWSHMADNVSEMIIIDPSTGIVYHAGDFGEGVWPAAGLYVNGSVAPASEGDEPMDGAEPAERTMLDEAVAETINARYLTELEAFFGPISTDDADEDELPLDSEEPVDEEEPVETEEPVIVEEPIDEPEPTEEPEPIDDPEPTDDGSAAFGTLNAIRGFHAPRYMSAAGIEAIGEPETDAENGTVDVTLIEEVLTKNGVASVTFKPAEISYLETESFTDFLSANLTENADGTATVTVAYAAREDIVAGKGIAALHFTIACDDTEAQVSTSERNGEFNLSETEALAIEGRGHQWGAEPTWTWADDFSSATATFVCEHNSEHTRTVDAVITSETTDPQVGVEGKTVYTATATLDGVTATDTREVTIPALEPYAEIYASSLTLTGAIGLNFYVFLPDELAADPGAYATLNGEKTLASDVRTYTINGRRAHCFPIMLYAKQMNDEVTFRLYDGSDKLYKLMLHDEDITETGFTTTIMDYVERARASSATTAKLLALVNAVSDYGSWVQEQHSYRTETRAEVLADLSTVTLADLAPYAPIKTIAADSGVSYAGSSLFTVSAIRIRHYFSIKSGSLSDYVFTVDGKEVTPQASGSYYYVDIDNIAAKDLDEAYVVSVTKNGTEIIHIEYSAMSYSYSVLNSAQPETLTNVAKTLYLYSKAANEYFG